MSRVVRYDLPRRRTGRIHPLVIEDDVHLPLPRLIDCQLHEPQQLRRHPTGVARQADAGMDDEAIDAVGLEIVHLPQQFVVRQFIVPEPKGHERELPRRVAKLGQHVLGRAAWAAAVPAGSQPPRIAIPPASMAKAVFLGMVVLLRRVEGWPYYSMHAEEKPRPASGASAVTDYGGRRRDMRIAGGSPRRSERHRGRSLHAPQD